MAPAKPASALWDGAPFERATTSSSEPMLPMFKQLIAPGFELLTLMGSREPCFHERDHDRNKALDRLDREGDLVVVVLSATPAERHRPNPERASDQITHGTVHGAEADAEREPPTGSRETPLARDEPGDERGDVSIRWHGSNAVDTASDPERRGRSPPSGKAIDAGQVVIPRTPASSLAMSRTGDVSGS